MVIRTLRNYFHPFVGRILFWNAVLLVLVKLVLPQSAFQLASFIDTLPVFDSREVIKITNEVRAANQLPLLKANANLDRAAADKLNDMATSEYFAHVSPTGVTPWVWIQNANYSYSVAGENLAIGFLTANEAVKAWMDSPSHRANILHNRYQEIGVAVRGVELEGREGILIVQMFGTPSTRVLPSKTVTSPAPSIQPLASVAGTNLKVETIAVQHVTTDETAVKPLTEPAVVRFDGTEDLKQISGSVNKVFSAYTLAIAVLSIIAFLLFESSRTMAMKVSFNFALFVLSLAAPVSEISLQGAIF